jgi:quercetin 2,3-dioxygenase
MNIVRANPEQLFEYGPFTVRRQRPGEALSPLVSVDLMSLKLDARIPMQQHQDEEVFTTCGVVRCSIRTVTANVPSSLQNA